MTGNGITQIVLYLVILTLLAYPLGIYMARVYAGTEPADLHRSYDLGKTWHELSSLTDVPNTEKWTFPPPPHIAHVKNVIFDPRDASVIYAAVEQGALLKTTDAGASTGRTPETTLRQRWFGAVPDLQASSCRTARATICHAR